MKKYIFLGLTLLMSLAVAAQDIKPAKDKSTKKYGYQAKNKTWVIAPRFDDAKKFVDGLAEVELGGYWGLIDPAGNMVLPALYNDIGKFDKHGYCELMRKENGVKLRGIADRSGHIIIPVECRNVDVDRSGEFIYAKYDTALQEFGTEAVWGVYDNQGRQIFAPQFSYTPSFYDGGAGIAKSAVTGLYGIIGANGTVLKPFRHLYISHFSGGYKALGTDLTHYVWSPDVRDSQALRQPGAVIPYDPQDDPVRVAAWHKGPVGRRLYSNSIRVVEMQAGFLGSVRAACTLLPIDWGRNRFIRLEPCVVPAGTPDAMYYGSGNRWYTLKAILYEADGTLVQEVCSRGWIEGDCREGAVYNADGKQRWIIMANPNALGLPAYTQDIHDYRGFGHADVYEGLGFTISEISDLRRLYQFTSRCNDIYETENVGVCTYLPRVPDAVHARAEFAAAKSPIFHYPLHMGEVVNCIVKHKDGKPEIKLTDDLVCIYKDRIEDPSYTMSEREEVIFWGPNNARTVRLGLEAAPRTGNFTADDVYGTGFSYRIVLDMFEEDGTWLRTLAAAPWIDYIQNGIVIFEPLGIALISPFNGMYGQPYGQPGGQHPGGFGGQQPYGQPGGQKPGQHPGQQPVQPQGNVGSSVSTGNRSGQTGRSSTPVTTTQGGARNSTADAPGAGSGSVQALGQAPAAGPAPAPLSSQAPLVDLQPLPHTLSAIQGALTYGK
jgi:hypothetical protein